MLFTSPPVEYNYHKKVAEMCGILRRTEEHKPPIASHRGEGEDSQGVNT